MGKYSFILSCCHWSMSQGQPLALWVVNDTRDVLKGELRLNVYALDGRRYSSSHAVEVTSQSSRCIVELTEVEVLQGRRAEEVMVELISEGFAAPSNRYFLRDPKDVTLPESQLSVHVNEEEQSVTVTASGGIARLVKLELPLGRVRLVTIISICSPVRAEQ